MLLDKSLILDGSEVDADVEECADHRIAAGHHSTAGVRDRVLVSLHDHLLDQRHQLSSLLGHPHRHVCCDLSASLDLSGARFLLLLGLLGPLEGCKDDVEGIAVLVDSLEQLLLYLRDTRDNLAHLILDVGILLLANGKVAHHRGESSSDGTIEG